MQYSQSLKQFGSVLETQITGILSLCRQLTKLQYFEQVVLMMTIIIFFVIGRLSYRKRLAHLLQIVNDAQIKKQKLLEKKDRSQKILVSIKRKRYLVIGFVVVLVLSNIGYCYLTGEINLYLVVCSMLLGFLVWLVYFVPLRYYQWRKNQLEDILNKTKSVDGSQISQVIKVFGTNIEHRLQVLYEQDIERQRTKQMKEDCKQYKCYNEKISYQNQYKLYQEIINEIKTVSMCDICLSSSNINVQNLGLMQMENMINDCKRMLAFKEFSLSEKKMMVNRLLNLYEKMKDKPNIICKRGCCIKQRVQIQLIKSKFHERLKKCSSHGEGRKEK